MERPPYIPADYKRIKVVDSLSALFNARFNLDINGVLYPRSMTDAFNTQAMDFKGLANILAQAYPRPESEFCKKINRQFLSEAVDRLALDGAALAAARLIMADMEQVERHASQTILRIVEAEGYRFGDESYFFHADTNDRILCVYTDPVTEVIRNADALRNESGLYFPRDKDVKFFQFRPGDVWKQEGNFLNKNFYPFIHRTPPIKPADGARLLLVADLR